MKTFAKYYKVICHSIMLVISFVVFSLLGLTSFFTSFPLFVVFLSASYLVTKFSLSQAGIPEMCDRILSEKNE